jgi:AcrR family transcriptional regulator
MQSLRDRQKLQRRVGMLDAARELFIAHGYSRTTMDAIAERAGVGVATVYTYFTSKEGVFAELARMDMAELRDAGDEALKTLPADPVEAILRLLDIYSRAHDYVSYEVIRDFTVGARTNGPLREVARWITEWELKQLAAAMEKAQRAGALSPTLPVRDAAQIICDLLDRYYERATSEENDRRALGTLRRSVKLLFTDWRARSTPSD